MKPITTAEFLAAIRKSAARYMEISPDLRRGAGVSRYPLRRGRDTAPAAPEPQDPDDSTGT